jgi:hypothetical protein
MAYQIADRFGAAPRTSHHQAIAPVRQDDPSGSTAAAGPSAIRKIKRKSASLAALHATSTIG